jgi:hypothetical protein
MYNHLIMIGQNDLVMYIINVPDFQEVPERRNFVAAITRPKRRDMSMHRFKSFKTS